MTHEYNPQFAAEAKITEARLRAQIASLEERLWRMRDAAIHGIGADYQVSQLRKREPTREEMIACLGDRDELAVGDRCPDSWATIRRCRYCREPVAGGPTACISCVARREGDARADLAERVLADAVESGRVAVCVVVDRITSAPFVSAPVDQRSIPAALTVRLGDDAVIEADAALVGALVSLYRVESSALGRGMATTSESAVVVRQIDEMMRARREAAQEEIKRAEAEEAS